MVAGLIDPPQEVVLGFERTAFGRNKAKYDHFVRRHEAQWREPARARRVVLQKEERDGEIIEQPLRDRIVAALRMPAAAAIASAQMHCNREALRQVAQHAIGDGYIGVDQCRPIVAARCQHRPHSRIGKLGKGRFIDLHVATAGHRKGREFGAKCRNNVIPESIDVLVGVRQYRAVAPAEMERARARNGDFRTELGLRLDERKIVDMDRLRPTQAATDERNRLRRKVAGRNRLPTCSALNGGSEEDRNCPPGMKVVHSRVTARHYTNLTLWGLSRPRFRHHGDLSRQTS
jgi:hypothetical protein